MSAKNVFRTVRTPVELTYTYVAGQAQRLWLEALREGRMVGLRCPRCGAVYFQPTGFCSRDGVLLDMVVALTGMGTVIAHTIVDVSFFGQMFEPPYPLAQITLDGTDVVFFYPVLEVALDDVHPGLRVEPVWRPPNEWTFSLGNVKYFRPNGEPDASFDQVQRYY